MPGGEATAGGQRRLPRAPTKEMGPTEEELSPPKYFEGVVLGWKTHGFSSSVLKCSLKHLTIIDDFSIHPSNRQSLNTYQMPNPA